MKTAITVGVALWMLCLDTACSNQDKAPTSQGPTTQHIWSDQVQALDTAKEVQGLINRSMQQQQKALNQDR